MLKVCAQDFETSVISRDAIFGTNTDGRSEDSSAFRPLATELVDLKVDVIVTYVTLSVDLPQSPAVAASRTRATSARSGLGHVRVAQRA